MQPHHWLAITGFLGIIRHSRDLDHADMIRRDEKHGLKISAWDIREAIILLCPDEDWEEEEKELFRILGI